MTDELTKLIEEARGHNMTDEERAVQRVSFAFGNLALDIEGTSRKLVQAVSDYQDILKQRDQWMKNYHRVSHEYDRLLVTAVMYRIAALTATTLFIVTLVLLWSR